MVGNRIQVHWTPAAVTVVADDQKLYQVGKGGGGGGGDEGSIGAGMLGQRMHWTCRTLQAGQAEQGLVAELRMLEHGEGSQQGEQC